MRENLIRREFSQYTTVNQSDRITQYELVLRIWTTFVIIIPGSLILSAYHDLFAMLFIASELGELLK